MHPLTIETKAFDKYFNQIKRKRGDSFQKYRDEEEVYDPYLGGLT